MKKLQQQKKIQEISKYKYGYSDGDIAFFKTERGLSEDIIRKISSFKKEPIWMLKFRLDSYKQFLKIKNPTWGPDLSFMDFDKYYYFVKATEREATSWDDVPNKIKTTFNRLGIPKAEREFLAGIKAQYDSESIYGNMLKEATDKGVIFTDCDTALREYPELFKKYFATIVKNNDNKYAALNSAVWSGGSFIYVPKGVKLQKPLQAYFRINFMSSGQFERTLIIVEDDAELHYIEGCTAPIYSKDSLHAAIVEIFIGKNAKVKYTTIQNWSDNVINLVTKRSYVRENGLMEWIDGNIGSRVNMKYPSCILAEPFAKGSCISIAVAKENVFQDAGSKMIHLAKYTSSNIVSKSMTFNGGIVNYRGLVKIGKNAQYSKARVQCDTLILDNKSKTDTVPTNQVLNSESQIEHEATVSKISDEQIFYLMSRGLKEEDAIQMIIMGFLEPFTKEIPMEYAVELNQLLEMSMEGSVG